VTTDDRDLEAAAERPAADHTPTPHYAIRVDGHLGHRWTAWFDGLSLTCEPDGTTVIAGPVADQAALHGVLQKLRDLGIRLRSLTLLDPAAEAAQPDTDHPRPATPGATP